MENKLTVGPEPRRVRPVGPRARIGQLKNMPAATASIDTCHAEPEVRVNKQGNRIDSIVIRCSCGEEITVICGYDQPE